MIERDLADENKPDERSDDFGALKPHPASSSYQEKKIIRMKKIGSMMSMLETALRSRFYRVRDLGVCKFEIHNDKVDKSAFGINDPEELAGKNDFNS